MKLWTHTDADFTFKQLADTIAWLIDADACFDPIETEDLNADRFQSELYPAQPHKEGDQS